MDIYYLEYDGGKIHPSYFQELNKLLGPSGLNIKYEMKHAPKQLSEKFENLDFLVSIASYVKEFFGIIPNNTGLIAFSKPNSLLQELGEQEIGHAKWGFSTRFGQNLDLGFSAIYSDENNLNSQIHETLHLFHVDDCYIVDEHGNILPHPDCTHSDCIMRYTSPSLKICERVKTELFKYKGSHNKKN